MAADLPTIEIQRAALLDVLQALAEFGRRRRAMRERAGVLAAEDVTDDESQFTAAMRQANQQGADDEAQ